MHSRLLLNISKQMNTVHWQGIIRRTEGFLSASKLEQLKALAESFTVDLGVSAHGAMNPGAGSDPHHQQLETNCTIVDGKRLYNFDQLVEALGGAGTDESGRTRVSTDSNELPARPGEPSDLPSFADTMPRCTTDAHSSLPDVWQTTLDPGRSSADDSRPKTLGQNSGRMAGEETTFASEMFGRRKMQLVLDVSRVKDIKLSMSQGEAQRLIPFSCQQLAQTCSFSIQYDSVSSAPLDHLNMDTTSSDATCPGQQNKKAGAGEALGNPCDYPGALKEDGGWLEVAIGGPASSGKRGGKLGNQVRAWFESIFNGLQ